MLAENDKEGVDLFRVLADKISVVLLDMTMPVTSGYNEVEAVRRFTGKGSPVSSRSLTVRRLWRNESAW